MSQEEYKNQLAKLDPAKEIKNKQKHFTVQNFTEKLLNYAKKMGIKLTYYSLLLFYSFQSPHTPKKDKLTIAGALGYLILPVDIIPDFIPVIGFTDDLIIIVYAVYRVINHIDQDVKKQADERMKKLFGEEYDDQAIDDNLKSM
ncbi:MAG TPA: YkvA family protein [Virgibacillus sp.]|nr:YkvA family protein [Virgibacillus sp.]